MYLGQLGNILLIKDYTLVIPLSNITSIYFADFLGKSLQALWGLTFGAKPSQAQILSYTNSLSAAIHLYMI